MIDFAVVGAGPVGLFVACRLAAAGRAVVVLEQEGACLGHGRAVPGARARAIGIHPPALEALSLAGVAEELIACGERIETARLRLGPHPVGSLSLRGCPGPYPFVLSLPQHRTEAILTSRLETSWPGVLHRDARVVGVRRGRSGPEVDTADGRSLRVGFVIGCDGRASRVRGSFDVPVEGQAFQHHYLMADTPDDGSLGADALISLGREGVVESFPLPGRRRRWVARLAERTAAPLATDLAAIVERRTGLAVIDTGGQASAFTAERRLASRLAGDGWALAGDAAHVISPIGGQGMNLGLIGGLALVRALTAPAGVGPSRSERLAEYDRAQRKRARAAARRAAVNMFLGRDGLATAVRWSALRTVLLPGLDRRFARYFTMRGLGG